MDRYIQIEKAFNPEYFEEGKVVVINIKKDFLVNMRFEDRSDTSVLPKFTLLGTHDGETYIGWIYKCSYNTLEILIPRIKNGQLYENCIVTLDVDHSNKFEIYKSDDLCFIPKSSGSGSDVQEYAEK